MGKKPLKIKRGKDVVRHVINHPNLQSPPRWTGDHVTVDGPEGRITACNSDYEYPKHLRRKIIRHLVAIGLGVVALLPFLLP